MKKNKTLLAVTLALVLTGCAAPAATAPDNSAELESLKAQVEELQKENTDLKKQLETTAAETTIAEPEVNSTGDAIQPGEAGTLNDWSVTVSTSQTVDSIPDGYGSFSPDEGNKYLVVSVSVTNNGKTADTFLPSFGMGDDVQAKLLYGDGYEFSATQLLGYSKSLHDQTLNPLSTKEGDIAFEIPDSVASATDEIVLQLKAGNNSLNIKVR